MARAVESSEAVEICSLGGKRELGSSGGAPTAVAYPVLTLCTGLAGKLWPDEAALLLIVVSALLVVGVVRELTGKHLRQAQADQLESWYRRYAVLVLLQATLWTAFASGIVWVFGVDWTGLMAVVTTGGIVAGSASSLPPSYGLMRVYVAVVTLPVALALAHHRTRPELMVAATLVTFCYFMTLVGRRNTQRYEILSRALGELEEARSESELHRSRWQSLAQELRGLTAAQQEALEQERLHLSREVHDDLGQLLTGLKISLARLEKNLESPAGLERLRESNDLVDATLASVRRISSSLRPPLLDELGLVPAIDRFLAETLRRANIEYQLQASGDLPQLSREQSLAAFRVCQEAVTNAIRHAQARLVTVEITRFDQSLRLQISDDGVGFHPESANSSLGLLGLRERLRLLGGAVEIDSGESGTRLLAHFPLKNS